MVHADLISGLAGKEIAIDFLKRNTQADGIISTKLSFIKRAKELGMATVFRFFVIDSMAFDNIQKQYEAACPDFVEILPGIMPKIIAKVAKMVSAPVIAGGLIAEKADIYAAIEPEPFPSHPQIRIPGLSKRGGDGCQIQKEKWPRL